MCIAVFDMKAGHIGIIMSCVSMTCVCTRYVFVSIFRHTHATVYALKSEDSMDASLHLLPLNETRFFC